MRFMVSDCPCLLPYIYYTLRNGTVDAPFGVVLFDTDTMQRQLVNGAIDTVTDFYFYYSSNIARELLVKRIPPALQHKIKQVAAEK